MDDSPKKVSFSDAELRDRLTSEQYTVTRHAGTERAFTGAYHDCKDPGMYCCICCGSPLFDAAHKFDSGTGWPSYWQPVSDAATASKTDRSLFSTRTEILCAVCDAHLGHVFPDGPEPTGQRYCINSASLVLDRTEKDDDPA